MERKCRKQKPQYDTICKHHTGVHFCLPLVVQNLRKYAPDEHAKNTQKSDTFLGSSKHQISCLLFVWDYMYIHICLWHAADTPPLERCLILRCAIYDPWKGCKFEKIRLRKWWFRIWISALFDMFTCSLMVIRGGGGCDNVLDEYYTSITNGWYMETAQKWRPMSMLHKKNQQVYKKRCSWACSWTWRHDGALLESVATALPKALWHRGFEKRKEMSKIDSPRS